jgi:hypothetical protein
MPRRRSDRDRSLADGDPGLGDPRITSRAHGSRDTEVRDQYVSSLEQNVLGLDVAMDDPRECACASASATCPVMSSASSRRSCLSLSIRVRSDSPSTNRHDVKQNAARVARVDEGEDARVRVRS